MEWLEIFQLLTIPVSLLALVVTSIITIRTSKSANIANTIAAERIKFLEEYRALTAKLLTLCSPEVIKKESADISEIVHTAYTLKSIFRTCYEEEKRINSSVDCLLKATFEFIDNKNDSNEQVLNNNICNLFHLIEIYDLAYWRFIIDQSIGTHYKVDDFEKYYHNAMHRFN